MLNSPSFCLSVKLLISPSYLNEILAGYSNLGCRFFSFITLSMSCCSLWPEEFLLKDQLLSLWGSPYVLFVAFPLLLLTYALCVLVGAFKPFTFKVIIDKYDPIAIYLVVLDSGL